MNNEEVQALGVSTEFSKNMNVLGEKKLEKIHEATLTVLQEAGIKFPSDRALKIFADAGADVDFDTNNVKIPPEILMNAIEKAPRSFTLGSRTNADLDLTLDGANTYFRNSGVAPHVVDLETGKKRASKKSDVAMMGKIVDSLSMLSFYWPIVSAQDKQSAREFHELEASILSTEKHVQTESVLAEKPARYTVEIAKVLAGDRKTLTERPPISTLICPIDPLANDRGGVEAALVFAEENIPVVFDAMPTIFSSAPGTLAGALVVGNAELISLITLMQLFSPGTPVVYFMVPALLNPQTGGYAQSHPYAQLLSSASVELGHYYDVPTCRTTVFTEGLQPGTWQTGKDAALASTLTLFDGSDLAGGGLGLLDSVNLLDPTQVFYDHQVLEYIKSISEGIKVDQENLAVDEIIDVGPRGNFLTSNTTTKHLRELWSPSIDHELSDKKDETYKPTQEAVREKLNSVLENHEPVQPDEKVIKEIQKIIKAAEKELSE